jgi:hypothetical protein
LPRRIVPAGKELALHVQELRVAGATYAEIARAAGVGVTTVWRCTDPDRRVARSVRVRLLALEPGVDWERVAAVRAVFRARGYSRGFFY